MTGNSVYGDDWRLRMWLETQEQAYVLAVSGKEYVWVGWQQRQVKTVLAALPAEGWTRHSAGAGAKGPAGMTGAGCPWPRRCSRRGASWLVVRRSVSDPTALTAFVVLPAGNDLAAAVQIAGTQLGH